MTEFLTSIQAAAKSPYALAAYAIAAVIFILVGAQLKTVRSVLKAISNVPANERRKLIETITGSVIPNSISADQWVRNNRNRWLFLLAATTVVLVSVVAVTAVMNPAGPGKEPPAESAQPVVESWLAKMDSFQLTEAYEETHELFKSNHTLKKWLEVGGIYRTPLGKVESRTFAGSSAATYAVNGVQVHGYAYQYVTKFENWPQPIEEQITLMSRGLPEPWVPSGYFVNVPPTAPFLTQQGKP